MKDDMDTINVYTAIPVADADDTGRPNTVIKKETPTPATWCSPRCKLVASLLLLGYSVHVILHELVFKQTKFAHFDHMKHPCPHHRPHHGNMRHHHNGVPTIVMEEPHPHHISMGPMDGDMVHHPKDYMMDHNSPPMKEEFMHPFFLPPPIPPEPMSSAEVEESTEISNDSSDIWEQIADVWKSGDDDDRDIWERFADVWHVIEDSSDDSKDSSEKESMDSVDSSDSGDELDVWERVADAWEAGDNDKRDVWQRFGDVWNLMKDSSDEKNESSDSNDSSDIDEHFWERLANKWTGATTYESYSNTNEDVEYVTDVWERDTEVHEGQEDDEAN